MQKQFRIAVLIPAYNAEPFICEALDSVARETRRPDEVIVVDDGSTDGTVEIVRNWMTGSDLGVRLIQQENQGAPAAQNNALRHTKADLVAILDSDDIWLPNCLEVLEHGFQVKPELVCCFGDAEIFDANGLIARSFFRGKLIQSLAYEQEQHDLRIITDSIYGSLVMGSYIPTCSTLLTRVAIEAIGGFDESLVNGYDRHFLLRLSRRGKFGYYPFPLSKIRQHDKNLTHDRNALRIHRNSIAVLTKVLQESRQLNLTPSEIQCTFEAANIHGQALLYHASLRGFRSYRRARCQIANTDFVNPGFQPRHFLRALYYSLPRPQKR